MSRCRFAAKMFLSYTMLSTSHLSFYIIIISVGWFAYWYTYNVLLNRNFVKKILRKFGYTA